MPAKVKKAFAPKSLGSQRIPLKDLSVEEDSGWRDEDEDRVAEIVQMIKDVAYIRQVTNMTTRLDLSCESISIFAQSSCE